MSAATHRIILTGLGNVGRSFLEILLSHGQQLRDRYGVAFTVVGAADSGGAATDSAGLDVAAILAAKQERRSIATLPSVGRPGMSGLELARGAEADLLLEATPVNLRDGQPGLDIVRTALGRGMSAVLANKGPLALAYQELARMSDLATDERGTRNDARAGDSAFIVPHSSLRFSACCGGAMPTINIGRRDLIG